MSVFMTTLKDLRQGLALDDLGDQLVSLVAHVRSTGRPGKLLLALTVKPASKGNTDVLAIEDAVTVKLPKAETGSTILYATSDNTLSRKDPKQPELSGLREVPIIRAAVAAEGQ